MICTDSSTARTLGCEELDYDEKYIERCLAHKTKENLGETYDKTQYHHKEKEFIVYGLTLD